MKVLILKDCVMDTFSNSSGVALYFQIENLIKDSQFTVIDLKDSTAISSSFFNSSFGSLIERFGYNKVKETLRFTNASSTQVQLLQFLFGSYKELST